jgi:1-deoxy-D-xylulose-5-phosphate synthase
MGGYGAAVLETLSELHVPTPVARIGWPDQFIEHATSQDVLRQRYGLTVENIVAKAKAVAVAAPARLAAAVSA